jgi:hypothetical protein
VSKPLPIEIGGVTPPAVRRAGRLGDGWLATGKMAPAELEQKIKQLHALRREAGRDGPFEVSFGNQLGLERSSVERYAELGVTRLMLMAPFPPDGKFTLEYAFGFIDRCGELIAKAA